MGKFRERTSRGKNNTHTRTVWREVDRLTEKQAREASKGSKGHKDQQASAAEGPAAEGHSSSSQQASGGQADGAGSAQTRGQDQSGAFSTIAVLSCTTTEERDN